MAQDLPLITLSYLVSAITTWPKPVIVRTSNSPKVTAIVISSKNLEQSLELLKSFNFPFKSKGEQ